MFTRHVPSNSHAREFTKATQANARSRGGEFFFESTIATMANNEAASGTPTMIDSTIELESNL